MGLEEDIRAQMEPLLTDLGVELMDVTWGGARLRLTVDTEGGISSSLLATATRTVSRELDTTDPIPGKFTLEVTSPGLERPLRRPEHHARAIGDDVSVKLVAAAVADGDRRVRGVLRVAEDDRIVVETSDGTMQTIAMADIAKARTIFEWGPKSKEATAR